jgi:DNA-binding NtrC family response regulator
MTGVAAALPQIPVETPVRRQPCRKADALDVLVLDNDPLTVEATAALLTAMGHRPHGAEDGDGRAVLRKDHVDAVLADFRLDTEEDGLVASLRSIPTCPRC